MRIIGFITSLLAALLAGFMLFNDNFVLMPAVLFLLSISLVFTGIYYTRSSKYRTMGLMNICLSLFVLFTAIYILVS
ncbi:hypothetical protein MM300_18795 [Evansella sp. LMS18]|jgi:hypothetical protein|uniref:hypothetical protein n=1 Tax=Evansella sp. LMS18 TaxID=2924033 RepID=UPI0020D019A2|nr:hypothetical protein [Evansella sp. LMS18]UTR09910.1 hypothetical protein MM300_18795 [Evansella sp. LMS18]